MITKKEFKTKVFNWLKDNNITGKKLRVYDTRCYGLEVRVYNEPMEMLNSRKSFRENKEEREIFNGRIIRHGNSGYFMTKISTYTPINIKDFENKKEMDFILECIKNS